MQGEGKALPRAVAVMVATMSLLLAACGARLTEAQRNAGIGLAGGGGSGGTDGGFTDGTAGGTTGTGGAGGGTATGGAGTTTTGGVNIPPSAPPGGNGGATDVGVTATKLTIATVADVQGVQPGLFKSAHQAMQALVAMVNSQGGIDGRLLDLVLLDSKIDTGHTRTAVLAACNKAFALVGSMSAFDDGGADAVENCKIPDITAITTTRARIQSAYTYPAYPNRPDLFIVGSGTYIANTYPSAIKKAAQLWLNTGTTKSNAKSKRTAYKSVGFDFTYTAETQVVESNYTPFVQKMKDQGIQFVTMLSDFQSIARLTDAMRKQRWKPAVMEWDSVAYSDAFLKETKGAAEGSYIYLNTGMFEESQNYPEMQLYLQWLARVAPGAKPEYFGLYAWSAGRMFVELAKRAGPKLTREKLMKEIRALHAWDANGLHASHDIGNKRPSNCTMFAKIKGNKFVRAAPASGYNCNLGALYRVE